MFNRDTGEQEFFLSAPYLSSADFSLFQNGKEVLRLPMERNEKGTFSIRLAKESGEMDYMFLLEQRVWRPDPASHWQPGGVHGPSRTVGFTEYERDRTWTGIDVSSAVFYEFHTGTFTDEGTFAAAIKDLDRLKALGVTAVEVMPVSAFPGVRNWGYDGVYPFAVQDSYGGPEGFHDFIFQCHRRGLGVVLDVVYNHMGPEGNYLREFGPYFTDSYSTPWGDGMNFDGPGNEILRSFFLLNAEHWFVNYGIDALRIDAIHGIKDNSPVHFLRDLQDLTERTAAKLGKKLYLISESDLNDSTVIRNVAEGGYGHRAQWSDDFHHCVHTLLTGESSGYYRDFGKKEQLVRAMNEGYVYQGDYSVVRGKNHGNSTAGLEADQFVFFIQNHDQVGNRFLGERLSVLVDEQRLRLAAGLLLLSPGIPLLFMGEEYGERNPFLYFIDHEDPDLIQAVREGRKREFSDFHSGEEIPDPASEESYRSSRLNRKLLQDHSGQKLNELYRELIRFRQEEPSFQIHSRAESRAWIDPETGIVILDRGPSNEYRILFYFEDRQISILSGLVKGRNLFLDSRTFPEETSQFDVMNGPGFRILKRTEIV